VGNAHPGLKQQLHNKASEIDATTLPHFHQGQLSRVSAEKFMSVGRWTLPRTRRALGAVCPINSPDELTIDSALAVSINQLA
jgi:hypothetical protein